MAIGPGPEPGQSYIYAGDIGDNPSKRKEIVVFRVREPSIKPDESAPSKQSPIPTEPAVPIRLKYPDGSHNAEALMVHPSTGDLYIVTKAGSSTAGVYKLRAAHQASGSATLEHLASISFRTVTGGAISSDGRRVAICGYFEAIEFDLGDKIDGAFDEIWKQTPVSVDLGTRLQGESVCYRADGKALIATSEGSPCPLIEIVRRQSN